MTQLCMCTCLVSEEQCLTQIHDDELFGAQDWNPVGKKAEEDKKKSVSRRQFCRAVFLHGLDLQLYKSRNNFWLVVIDRTH